MQWLTNTSNTRVNGQQAFGNAVRNAQLQNAADALNNLANGSGADDDQFHRNRDRDTHEVVFPALANNFDADPRGALLRNIDPTIPRENVEQWADDHLDNVVPYINNARATEAEMQNNPQYLFLQQVLSYVKDKNSGLAEQLSWADMPSATQAQSQAQPQSNIRITVDANSANLQQQQQQQVTGGARIGAVSRPTAVQPGDIVFASGTTSGGLAAIVAANARRTLDAPQTTGRFTINSQLRAVCNQAISSLNQEDNELFGNSTLEMFIYDPDVRNAFANLAGETYLLNKLKSPDRTQYHHASDYMNKVKSRKASIRYLANNLHKVGDHFEIIPKNQRKDKSDKYARLFQ